jgi:hypothetical protein
MSNFSVDYTLLVLLIPLVLLQLALMIAALVHLFRHKNVKVGNVALWAVVIILLNILGPVLYFVLGRGEEKEEASDEG